MSRYISVAFAEISNQELLIYDQFCGVDHQFQANETLIVGSIESIVNTELTQLE